MTLDGNLNAPSDFLPMTVIYRKITKDEGMIICRETWTGWESGRL